MIVGKTYGLQFLPRISFLEWDSAQCHIANKFQVILHNILITVIIIIITITIIIIFIIDMSYC
jgi:hypothetical protein